MGSLPPVTRAAVAFSAGAALAPAAATHPLLVLPVLLLAVAPIGATRRPGARAALFAFVSAGAVAAMAGRPAEGCPRPVDGAEVSLSGHFRASPGGSGAPFRPVGARCADVRVLAADRTIRVGEPRRVHGTWRLGRGAPLLVAARTEPVGSRSALRGGAADRWRGRLAARLDRLYGPQAPVVSALVLARKEGLEPELRDGFARAGIAHLLAISGFHVGVIGGLFLGALRAAGLGRRRGALGAAAGCWLYVALIGFPDAAARAALILTALALSRLRGRPPARWGALSTALLVLVALEPARLTSPGFQLSFAGAGGLVAWARPWTDAIRSASRGRCPRSLASALAAGCAATVATLPIVAWHFERVSLVGIPVTLVASPVVVLALPGALATLGLDFVLPAAADFLAGGVGLLITALERGTLSAAGLPWASVWTSHAWLWAAAAGLLGARLLVPPGTGRTPGGRRAAWAVCVAAALCGWPLAGALAGWGTLEVVVLDVGQGDAIALRSPRGRWMLVDAGPPARAPEPGAHPVVRALRRRGVGRLETLVLTHADADHVGGAAPVLSELEVGAVIDPGRAAAGGPYVQALAEARARGVAWRRARPGDRLDLDGMGVEVLAPLDGGPVADTETNAASVVLRVRWGDFDALLTGDAPAEVERALVPRLARGFELLKVGHHGSDTSTDSLLLARTAPELAVVSVGRGNRYGHPSSRVLDRLSRVGAALRRTDVDGTVRIRARRDGSFVVSAQPTRRPSGPRPR